MCVYMHACTHVYLRARVHACVCARASTRMHVCLGVRVYTYEVALVSRIDKIIYVTFAKEANKRDHILHKRPLI